MEGFKAHLIQTDKSQRTWVLWMTYVRNFSKGKKGTPADVDVSQVVGFLGRPTWAPPTRKVAQAALVHFFRWAKEYNHIPVDPTLHLASVKGKGKTTEPATQKQIEAAMKVATPRQELMLRLAADAGLVAGEIALTRPRDVFERSGDWYVHVFGKGGKEHDVFLLPDLAADLRAKPGPYVFPGRINGHISPAYVSKLISRTLPKGESSRHLVQAHKTGGGAENSARGWREGRPFNSPDDLAFLEHPDLADSKAIQAQIKRLKRDLDRDPASAIGSSKELLESVFGAVLDSRGIEVGTVPFPQLFTKVADALGLPNSAVPKNTSASEGIDTLGHALWFLVWSIARVRNEIGTGHGHDDSPADPRDARLVFNATVAIAEYVSDLWRDQQGAS